MYYVVSVRDDSAEAAAVRLRRIESEALWHRHREEYRWALPPPARLFWRLPVIRHIRCAWRDDPIWMVHPALVNQYDRWVLYAIYRGWC